MSGIRSFRVDKGSHTNAPRRGNNTWAIIRNEVTGAHVLLSRLLGLLYFFRPQFFNELLCKLKSANIFTGLRSFRYKAMGL